MTTGSPGTTAHAQAAALASGQVSARALLENSLGRMADQDAALGAFWHVDAAGARAAADRSDARRRAGRPLGLFDGLGIAVKDNIDVADMPATAGIAAYRGRFATRDAPVVARLRAAGLVIVGKTALHEGGLGATTDTPGFGRCNNPLQTGFTPGGSSGGSAAAVAAGFVTLALGTDTMGSVRIPAAYCGVAGLKPTSGLVSRTGVMQLSATLDTVGALAATPRDAAMCLQLMAGFDDQDLQSRTPPVSWQGLGPTPGTGRLEAVIAVPRGLDRIGIEPGILDAFGRACRMLALRGARLVEVSIAGWEPQRLRRAALLLAEAEASLAHPGLIDDPAAASDGYRAALAYGQAAGPERLAAAMAEISAARAAILHVLQQADAIFSPSAPQRAFAHGTAAPANQADLTVLANAAGLPAIAVPWPAPDGGLPASMQVIGKPFAEARITAIAEALLV